ncbi:cobalamin (vitamin B12) biosynthesis CbiM protein [Clostridium bornimense]|uniref:Cobalamin (Vitamin B12) biosynthesis CbiM protein n=1 Tax=Clostridium bornimense TaxID=1216932 RepID=W6RVD4_9CLOT|nr:energy-coupling factor ABC transporter permease [Clostridium bornimense]CDM67564.1 cobalamin (vitamin B12) biosynthesis CbiM protein [Clostridium bornimense]
MHMADALITPLVGVTMTVATVGISAYSTKKIRKELEFDKKIPLMGVVGSFIFAAQMINFTIPGTGSSGHIGGGLLLAILLGPEAGFLSILSVLLIQALFFGDGGLLALGCNAINMGFFSCFIGYRLIYSKILSKGYSKKRIYFASILAAVISLQLGSFSVVVETVVSGITELPFSTFLIFMQPIHFIIAVVEGAITAILINFIWSHRPELLEKNNSSTVKKVSRKKIVMVFLLGALIVGGGLSIFASSNPDGLEWSILKTTGREEIVRNNEIHEKVASIQEKTTILPEYNLRNEVLGKFGTTVAGVIGVVITISFVLLLGLLSKKRKVIKE